MNSTAIAMRSEFDISRLVVDGDLSRLTPDQKSQYYILRCKEHGLNPSNQPFNYIQLNGKLVLYANKGCGEQLRSIQKVSIKIVKADKIDDLFVVIVEAKNGQGREDSATGAVPILGLKGEALANAMMKAETKAKRRVTLSICGLNMLDETEVASIQDDKGKVYPEQPPEGELQESTQYKIDFGKYNRKSLEEVGADELRGYVEYLEAKARKEGKEIVGRVADFIARAEEFIGCFENAEPGSRG